MEGFTSDIESWRKVHESLIESIIVAREAVAAAKAQRRYWLEEICANLTPEGKLTSASIWKKPSKKGGGKRKLPKVTRRKKSDDTETDEEEPTKKKPKVARPKKKKKVTLPPKKMHLKLKLSKQESDDDEEDDDETEDAATFSNTNQQPAEYSVHEQEAAVALSAVGTDMSHIPEELRPFMAAQEFGNRSPERTFNAFGGKEMRYEDEGDDEEGDENY
mmetsp:Transcript_780/g.1203  ORF Transcript_780/g.1203 Transcript_780/m.1203 type:complete len:218 (-) Transcript_780:46-699(-)|eukprot:CAMPEP_0194227098 /NCGR_PEP_ID=MMETSP0156-20130528/42684_1 /TAXON_ID=33649 /ORGANISM="Thalassionema nitzschioides, Strain L26-B" /LENGTH=217 /DNA_ID=CAMNT_0038959571 /DNA_START=96 /DNA_END=749 /DNA_ORIENTATION=+